MAKQILYSEEARKKLLNGVEKLTRAVATTLGPRGRNVAIDRKWGAPNVIHDGVTVAKEIELEDPFENMGASLVKEAASKTNDVAGDGTTTATVLADAITKEGMKLTAGGYNPMQLRQEIEEASQKVVSFLKSHSRKISTPEEITQVASISAGDQFIGKKIAEALEKVGRDGVVTVEEGKGLTLEIEYKEGMEFDHGYVSAYFVTNADKMEAEIANPYILITDKKISSLSEFLPFLEKFVKTSKDLVVIADDMEGEALATLVVNKLRGVINLLAVKAPGFGDRRKEMLEDIATLTGGTVISEDTGRKFESIELTDLGRADKVWADKDNCRIIGGKGDPKLLKGRILQIKRQIETEKSDFDKEKLQERLAKLSGGVAQINVGAATEIEMNEKKERVKDAVAATQAAYEEGIVIGGEMALFQAKEKLVSKGDRSINKNILVPETKKGFNDKGEEILYKALERPLGILLENAYGTNSSYVNSIIGALSQEIDNKIIEESKKNKGVVNYDEMEFPTTGHDVITGKSIDMFKGGIIDPVKVARSALQNAVSVATMILTTDCLISDIPEPKKDAPAGGMPGGMGGGMGEY